MVSRRAFLTGALTSLGAVALAEAPERSPFPVQRPEGFSRRAVPSIDEILSDAGLSGRIGFAVADATTGEMLEVRHPLFPMAPASTTKALTSAYALERLGPGYRFRTRVLSDGRLEDGRLDGDLWIVGSGDPLLDTDALDRIVESLVNAGVREVAGQLRLATDALPHFDQIDPSQLPHAGYNPSISALNLNFNRVHFEWERGEEGYDLRMGAPGLSAAPDVSVARMALADRSYPVYTFERAEARDEWTVAQSALGRGGSRWLPVRRPAAYFADVFRSLAAARGLRLPPPVFSESAPVGAAVLYEHVSEPLEEILRGMMRFSTNLTAEVVGLMATQRGGVRPQTLAESGAEMEAWLSQRLNTRNAQFVDHSGLGVESRIRPQDMTHALVEAGPNGLLRRIMRPLPMSDETGEVITLFPAEVAAKTGTLNFVSTLAGYVTTGEGRELAFAIFCGDLDRRAALTERELESPPGGRAYINRAKRLQQRLLQRWALAYA